MGSKNKLKRFAQMKEFPNVIEPSLDEVLNKDFRLKGKWHSEWFKNDRPIVLELGCGKGEYTVGLARNNPEVNYIGVDIKGARMWVGANQALEEGLDNVLFFRTRIEFISSVFGKDEISEVWITFPDPQLKERREKKRLTHYEFLDRYRGFVKPGGTIHLKTDSSDLYAYTQEVLAEEKIVPEVSSPDIYGELEGLPDKLVHALKIRTHYEQMFRNKGASITYTQFKL